MNITRLQRMAEVYLQLVKYKRQYGGNSPTIRWLQQAAGLSSPSVTHKAIDDLIESGKITSPHPGQYCIKGERYEV